jgi:adenylate cyclase
MAGAQITLRMHLGREGDDGLAAAERAIELDANLAEAHAAKARALMQQARFDESLLEVEIALRVEPESYDANSAAARWNYLNRRFDDAIRYWEKAAALVESDYMAAGMLVSCYNAIGDREGARRAARRSITRAEKIVAMEPDNGSAMGHGFGALAALGEIERAKEWAERAVLLDPENLNLRYNIACTLVTELNDREGALDLLEPVFEKMRIEAVIWARTDPDLDPIRDHPRFKKMLAAAEARGTRAKPSGTPAG